MGTMPAHPATPEQVSVPDFGQRLEITDERGVRRRLRRGDLVFTLDGAGYRVRDPAVREGMIMTNASGRSLALDVIKISHVDADRMLADGVDELHEQIRSRLSEVLSDRAVSDADERVCDAVFSFIRDGGPSPCEVADLLAATRTTRAVAARLVDAPKGSSDAVLRWLDTPNPGEVWDETRPGDAPSEGDLERAVTSLLTAIGRPIQRIDRGGPTHTLVPGPKTE